MSRHDSPDPLQQAIEKWGWGGRFFRSERVKELVVEPLFPNVWENLVTNQWVSFRNWTPEDFHKAFYKAGCLIKGLRVDGAPRVAAFVVWHSKILSDGIRKVAVIKNLGVAPDLIGQGLELWILAKLIHDLALDPREKYVSMRVESEELTSDAHQVLLLAGFVEKRDQEGKIYLQRILPKLRKSF